MSEVFKIVRILDTGELGKTYSKGPVRGAVEVFVATRVEGGDPVEFQDLPVNVLISNLQILNPDPS